MKIIYKIAITSALMASVSGCISMHPAQNQPETIPARIDSDLRHTEQARRMERRAESPTATRSKEFVKILRGNDWLRDEVDFQYTNAPLSEVLDNILGGRPVKFQFLEDVSVNQGGLQPGEQLELPDNSTFTRPAGLGGQVDAKAKVLSLPVTNPRANTIMQHLEAISTQTGLSYSIEHGVVIFSDYELKVFNLASNLIPRELTPIFQNDNATGPQLADVSSTLFSKTAVALSLLVQTPNQHFADNITNTITIAARKDVMRRVEKYIGELNRSGSRRVAVRVDVYDVNLTALGERSIDFAIENLASDISALSGVTTNIVNQGNDVVGATNLIRFGIDRPGRSLDGANGLITYLRQQGSITSRMSSEFVMSNNDTKTDVRTRVTPYVSRVSLTTNQIGIGQSSTAPTVETREANTGTAIQLSSTIVEDKVYLNLLLEESRLVSLNNFEFGDSEGGVGSVSGVLPVTEKVQSSHRVPIHDGETIAVSARQISQRELDTSNGSLIPILGDTVKKDESRVQTLIVLTAHVFE